MENPGTLLQRARLNRRFRMMSCPPDVRDHMENKPAPEPVHRSSHASYSALMRSHDRMRTRHINGQGGGNGA